MELVNGHLVFNSEELWNLNDVLAVIMGDALKQFAAQELNTYPIEMESIEEWKASLVKTADVLLEVEPDYDEDEEFADFSELVNAYVARREEAMRFLALYFHLLWD